MRNNKPKLLLCLALVLGGGLLGHLADAQNFPTSLPITNSNNLVKLQISGCVPTKLKIERTPDMLSVAIDTNGFEPAKITIDTNMAVVLRSEVWVYPAGSPKPGRWQRMLASGVLDFNLCVDGWHTRPDGIPQAGTKYVVEMDLAILETALPLKDDWMPTGPDYKVIWQRTWKQVVQ